MNRFSKKIFAVLLALWLPLFSGNALAIAVAMQAGNGCCPVAAQQDELRAHHDGATQHQPATEHDHSAVHQDDDAPCANPGICHLACTGYLAVAMFDVTEPLPSHQLFEPVSVSFHSVSSTPLVPPPLVSA